jgi:hypothetical protein
MRVGDALVHAENPTNDGMGNDRAVARPENRASMPTLLAETRGIHESGIALEGRDDFLVGQNCDSVPIPLTRRRKP